MIHHLIDGKAVGSKTVFANPNPATRETLAAVAAAKAAFPKWAATPAKQRARIMRRLGELITSNVPALAALETDDTGLPIHQTTHQLIPRAAENFEFFAEVATRMD